MKLRGEKFSDWENCQIHCCLHGEVLENGQEIDVRVRLTPTGVTQIFLGIYAGCGTMHSEEMHDASSPQTMAQAMQWGICRAKALATDIAAPKAHDLCQAKS
ncbi:hypothetical protein D9M71_734300 [compost metagenome]